MGFLSDPEFWARWVLAVAGAAHGNLVLLVFGVALSLPLVVWGRGIRAQPMIGGGILGYVAGEMMLKDDWIMGWLGHVAEMLHDALPAAVTIVLTALAWWPARREAAHAEAAHHG